MRLLKIALCLLSISLLVTLSVACSQTTNPGTDTPANTEIPASTDASTEQGIADASGNDSGSKVPKVTGKFSFFVTSLEAMQKLSGSKDGFGGDLGGLQGADRICQLIAEGVGAGHKTWKAFLSATKGPDGKPVHAIERIGKGPWYDRNERLIANNIQDLLSERPKGDPQAVKDLPNEHGQGQLQFGDNHDTLTGTNKEGKLASTDPSTTCQDWTSSVGPGSEDKVICGHSWPRSAARSGGGGPGGGARGGENWMSDHKLRGCTPGVNLKQDGRGTGNCVGCSGGYGGIYCFALTP